MDNPNILCRARLPMLPVPTYALYGEQPASTLGEPLHCESIPSRSRLHGWEIRPHRHDHFLQILYIESGEGTARFGAADIALRGPCVVVVPAGVVHGFQFAEDIDGVVVTAIQSGVAPSVLASFGQPMQQDLPVGQTKDGVHAALRLLLAAWGGPLQPWRSATLQAALTLMLAQLAALQASDRMLAGPAPTRAHRHVERFRALVESHFREHWPIEAYAARLGVTATQLNRVCRTVTGHSALSVTHLRLLAQAERELAFTTLSIKEVAGLLGFADAAYFSRFFVRHGGTTPTAYRRQARARLQ